MARTCRISGNDLVGGDIPRDHAAGADHRAIADRNAGEDDGTASDPDVAADPHRAAKFEAGTACLGIARVIGGDPGDVMQVSVTDFGRPLRNPLRVAGTPAKLISVKGLE